MIEVRKEKVFFNEIPPDVYVTLTNIKNHQEIMYSSNPNHMIKIRKIDSEKYVDMITGEIKSFNKTENRQESINEVRVTLKKLRNLINENFTGHINEKCFTLTYKENMRDTKKLYNDFKNFIKKVKIKYGVLDYLTIIEPQGRGAWHCHLLLKFKNNPGFIPGEVIEKLWGHGFVKVKRVTDYMGEYLDVYLSDLEYTEENVNLLIENGLDRMLKIKDVDVEGQTKRFIKGARLFLYPAGIQLFRKSKGIIYPEKIRGKYKDIKQKYNLKKITYKAQTEIYEDDKLINTIIHEQYKKCSLKN